ncbi:MAG: CYTH domain-containing protein [Ruminococcaceae bacterium]|nr:CYTH domain-containing protein [Oscillospiraceae bacterium]
MEIERKFLVASLPCTEGLVKREIEQGYISRDPEIRIRRKGDKFFITFKGKGDLSRAETEISISEEEYKELCSFVTSPRVIKKTRTELPLENGLIAELDEYHGELEGLFAVEVEFASKEDAAAFAVPPWFGKELTYEERVKNMNLAYLGDAELAALINEIRG